MVNCFQYFLMKSIFQTGISQQQSIQITYHFVYIYIIYIVFLLWKIIAVTLTTKKLCWSENVTFRLKCLARAYTVSVLCVLIHFYSFAFSILVLVSCTVTVLVLLLQDILTVF